MQPSLKVQNTALENAYRYCETLASNHYENFPIASRFLPKAMRRPITVIYAFSRTADDIADEGNMPNDERLAKLETYTSALLDQNAAEHSPIFIALHAVIAQYGLPLQPFHDLLFAFKQDVTKHSYQDFNEVLEYCRHSANPIGRLLLHLNRAVSEENIYYSDCICTALQLINFLQDLHADVLHRNRCYLPNDDMQALNINTHILKERIQNEQVEALIFRQLERAHILMDEGKPLEKRLTGAFGFEIRLIINAGLQVLDALSKRKDLYARPTLGLRQWPKVLWKAII